ncbi:MAG: DUF1499 domain-containing protein [Spirochaetes bacterium]|jgi:uncharacterized protein (DUF1499 family)|nr:DUF1499 domain-containing protein [Spirochaetota bacterium]
MILAVLKWIGIVAGALVVVAALVLFFGLVRLSRTQPGAGDVATGVTDGRFEQCPDTPNCVSTQADRADETHYVEPVDVTDAAAALDRAARWVAESPRGQIITRGDDYIYAVFSSRLFGFKDDVELYVPPGGGVVHVRSAARVGQGDMGVNRARYKAARSVLRGDL